MNFSVFVNYEPDKLIDCIVLGIFELNPFSYLPNFISDQVKIYISKIMKYGDFQGQIGQTLVLYNVPTMTKKRILLIGCGKNINLSESHYKKIIKACIKNLVSIRAKYILCSLINYNVLHLNMYRKVRFFVEISKEFLNFYEFKNFKFLHENPDDQRYFFLYIENIKKLAIIKLAIKHVDAIFKGIIRTKNLCNMPSNICNAKYLSEKSKSLQLEYPNLLNTNIISKREMEKLKMNAYLSVSYGSYNEPFMSIIRYTGNPERNSYPIVLIGKGVTFDSGGLSIKPSRNLDEMKYDMSGAATVYGVMTTISELQLPINVIGILAGCDNMIGQNSYRPGDIITSMSGKKIEILNTDAEGRLILCDVLTYSNRFNPGIIIDIATLTGACTVALGEIYTGLMSNNEQLAQDLINAGKISNDLVWRLPLHTNYSKDLQSSVADLNNSDKGLAGASVAACFLSKFVNNDLWAHLDIAGTAWSSSKMKGATGRPNKLLCEYLLNK
ncbi:leucyl aminopeptidase [Buchnera aphidicola]|uniref:leucyl aminopeptidase n=1 Tax=Buchnera aphidicola TaxID=9 RepID=UPI00094CC30F|nr:leucyl aminopeptidase [Buchnera aphidicola]